MTTVRPPVTLGDLARDVEESEQLGLIVGELLAKQIISPQSAEYLALLDRQELRRELSRIIMAAKRAQARRDEAERRAALRSAPGPLRLVNGEFQIPPVAPNLAVAQAICLQLEQTARLRELTRRERRALRTMRRHPGVHQPTAPAEFTIIAKSRVRQRSKAAKRARAAQRTMEGHRAALARAAAAPEPTPSEMPNA